MTLQCGCNERCHGADLTLIKGRQRVIKGGKGLLNGDGPTSRKYRLDALQRTTGDLYPISVGFDSILLEMRDLDGFFQSIQYRRKRLVFMLLQHLLKMVNRTSTKIIARTLIKVPCAVDDFYDRSHFHTLSLPHRDA